MSANAPARKTFLFVDDDATLLSLLAELFTEMSKGRWKIHTAQNSSAALAILNEHKVDLAVLDINMPVMDGVQFLRLLMRTNPGQQVAILTGLATAQNRKVCQELGAVLFLEKPTSSTAYREVFAALDALVSALPQEGFRGVMRQVGLQEVLQMECLGRKSSILEVFTSRVRGQIFIHDGSVVHAEKGQLQGEVALYSLLALRGGGFNLLPFVEPAQRSIQGQWEFLLMEAARLQDEGGLPEEIAEPVGVVDLTPELVVPTADQIPASLAPASLSAAQPRTAEVVLCSGAGEVLYAWECRSTERCQALFDFVNQQATELSQTPGVGRFDRVEIATPEGRQVCQVQTDRRLFVRTTRNHPRP